MRRVLSGILVAAATVGLSLGMSAEQVSAAKPDKNLTVGFLSTSFVSIEIVHPGDVFVVQVTRSYTKGKAPEVTLTWGGTATLNTDYVGCSDQYCSNTRNIGAIQGITFSGRSSTGGEYLKIPLNAGTNKTITATIGTSSTGWTVGDAHTVAIQP